MEKKTVWDPASVIEVNMIDFTCLRLNQTLWKMRSSRGMENGMTFADKVR